MEVWSEAWPDKGNMWWVKWQYVKGGFEYGLLNPKRRGRDEIKSRLGERVEELDFRQHDEWWAFYKRMDIAPNLEDDMTALEGLLDQQERNTLADQVAHEVLEFVHACDDAFKAST